MVACLAVLFIVLGNRKNIYFRDLFLTNFPNLYPLKIPENHRFSGLFRWHKMGMPKIVNLRRRITQDIVFTGVNPFPAKIPINFTCYQYFEVVQNIGKKKEVWRLARNEYRCCRPQFYPPIFVIWRISHVLKLKTFFVNVSCIMVFHEATIKKFLDQNQVYVFKPSRDLPAQN